MSGFKKPVSSRAHHIRRGLQARILQQSFEAAVRRMSFSDCSSTQHGCMVKGSESVMTSSLLSHGVTSPESQGHLSCALVSESPRSLKVSFACFFLGRWHPGKWCPVLVFITSLQAPFLTLSPGDGVAPHCRLSLTASQKPELDQHRVSSDSDASAFWNYQQSTYQIPQSSSTGKRKGGFRKISPLVTNLTFSKGRKFYLCLRTTSQYSLPR